MWLVDAWRACCLTCGTSRCTSCSASFTEDLRCVVDHVRAAHPEAGAMFAAGWSLGANILTMYLGEEGEATPLDAAVAMCNPFDLVSREGGGSLFILNMTTI